MTRSSLHMEVCPRCRSAEHVKSKLALVDRLDPARAGDERRTWECDCGVSVSVTDLKPEFVEPGSADQFVQGLYCERCDLGYVPESIAKPPRPQYQTVEGGWRRSNLDGTLGPLLRCISDDPESRDESVSHMRDHACADAEFDEIEASRTAQDLELRHGLGTHIVAATYAKSAESSGDLKAAQFWRRISSNITPR